MLLLYSHFLKKSLQFANFYRLLLRCKVLRFFVFLFVWSSIHSIGILFFAGRKYVGLVVVSNKEREETFAVSLQDIFTNLHEIFNTGSTIKVNCIKYRYITPVLLKNCSFHIFLNRSNFAFACFFLLFFLIFQLKKSLYDVYAYAMALTYTVHLTWSRVCWPFS